MLSVIDFATGLLMGDGSFQLARRQSKSNSSGYSYRPEIHCRLRADDRPLLEFLKLNFDGYIIRQGETPSNKHPMLAWVLAGKRRVAPLLQRIYATCPIDTIKLRQVKILIEWCAWRESWPYRLSGEGKAICESYRERMTQSRVFKEPG